MARKAQDQGEPGCLRESMAQTQNSTAWIISGIAFAVVVLCFLLLVSDYRVLTGEEKPPAFEPDMSGPPQWIGSGDSKIDARLLPPFGRVIRCRYFTGRSVTTVTFSESQIDSCPFVYRPNENQTS